MKQDLGFTASILGFGAGIFFWGYFLFEVPSNLILRKVGARLWIARVMVTWGIILGAMAFIQGLRRNIGQAQKEADEDLSDCHNPRRWHWQGSRSSG